MTIETYPEMNARIVAMLRQGHNPLMLYAAQRIEELEAGVKRLRASLREVLDEATSDHNRDIIITECQSALRGKIMTMKRHLNIFIPDDLLEALVAYAAKRGLNRSQIARLAIRRYVILGYDEPYTPPTLPNWQAEAWTVLLRGLFGDERLVLTAEVKPLLQQALAKLNEREAQILQLRFGLDGPRHTLEDVGAIFGIKRSRVHQVEAQALRRMRYWLRGSGIWGLLEG